MKRDDSSPAAYRASVEEPWQKDLLAEIRTLIFEVAPDVDEYIEYGMLAYGDLANLAAQKHHVALYVNPLALAEYKINQPAADCGKSCLRYRSQKSFDRDSVRELLVAVGDLNNGQGSPR